MGLVLFVGFVSLVDVVLVSMIDRRILTNVAMWVGGWAGGSVGGCVRERRIVLCFNFMGSRSCLLVKVSTRYNKSGLKY